MNEKLHAILAVLVDRLGGHVRITDRELRAHHDLAVVDDFVRRETVLATTVSDEAPHSEQVADEVPVKDVVARIDRLTGCQQCGRPLGRSPSSDFCGELCQQTWHATRTKAIPESGMTVEGQVYIRHAGAADDVPWVPVGHGGLHFEVAPLSSEGRVP